MRLPDRVGSVNKLGSMRIHFFYVPVVVWLDFFSAAEKPAQADPIWTEGILASASSGQDASHPSLAAGPAGHLYLVWQESWTDGQVATTRIRYREHNGDQWLPVRSLSSSWPSAISPSIAVDRWGQPHAVWLERGESSSKFLVRYTARLSGQDWLEPVQISSAERIGFEGNPQIAFLPQGDPIVAWADDDHMGNPEVFWNHIESSIWIGSRPLSIVDQYHSGDASMTALGDERIGIVWLDRRKEGYQPMLRILERMAWSSLVEIGYPESSILNPRIVWCNRALHFIYAHRYGISIRKADPHMFWFDPIVLPTTILFPRLEVAVLDEYTLLVSFLDTAGAVDFLCARKFSADILEFENLPSLVTEIKDREIKFSLALTAQGEPNLSWDDRTGAAYRRGVFYSAFRELPNFAFQRGDLDGRGLNLSDPIGILTVLFAASDPLPCMDAADADDDGHVALADVIYLLSYLFIGGYPPPEPFPGCGLDLTPDLLLCDRQICEPGS